MNPEQPIFVSPSPGKQSTVRALVSFLRRYPAHWQALGMGQRLAVGAALFAIAAGLLGGGWLLVRHSAGHTDTGDQTGNTPAVVTNGQAPAKSSGTPPAEPKPATAAPPVATTNGGSTKGSTSSGSTAPASGSGSAGGSTGSTGGSPSSPPSFPSGASTGPSGCSSYTQYSGTLDITTDGTTLNCIQLDGTLTINAKNVTVQNALLKGTTWWGVRVGNSNAATTNFKLLHSKLYTTAGQGPDNGGYDYGVAQESSGYMEVAYNDISGYKDGTTLSGGAYVHDNYIHNLSQFSGAHTQAIYVYTGPSQIKIEHNTLINDSPLSQATAAIYIAPDDGHQNDRIVTNNFLAGGAYALYGGDSTATNISVTNNTFSTQIWPDGGYYGAAAYWQAGNSGNIWSGNTWGDGPHAGQTVTP